MSSKIIYAINVCTITKHTDRYDKVAVNDYPVIIVCDEGELNEYLRSDDMKNFIISLFRTKKLYDAAVFRIRKISTTIPYDVEQLEVPVKEYVDVVYD